MFLYNLNDPDSPPQNHKRCIILERRILRKSDKPCLLLIKAYIDQQTSRLFSIKSKIKYQCAPETFCKIGTRWKSTFVISLSTSSSISASDVIHPWHAFTKFTARGCGKNTMSESGSGAVAARRRNKSRPSVLALLALIPRTPAASSLRYRSRRGGSDPDCATQSVIAREISGASRIQFGTTP
jgi:hypothetical protein